MAAAEERIDVLIEDEGHGKEKEGEVVEVEVVADEDRGKKRQGQRRLLSCSPEQHEKRTKDGKNHAPWCSAGQSVEEAVEIGHLGGEHTVFGLTRGVRGRVRHEEKRAAISLEGAGACDENREESEGRGSGEKSSEEVPLAPEKEDKGDGKSDLELDEREGEEDSGEDWFGGLNCGEAGAIEKEKEDRYLAQGERDGKRHEGEKQQRCQRPPS